MAGADYTAVSGTLTIPAGSSSATLNVPVLGETLFESDEAFTATLSGGSGYTDVGSTLMGVGTITNAKIATTISIANKQRSKAIILNKIEKIT